MSCTHHKDGRCTNALALPLYGDRPSPGVCRICPHHGGWPRGLGDVVHALAKLTGLTRLAPRSCGGCERRRQRLNGTAPTAPTAPITPPAPAQKSRGCGCSG